MGGFRRAPARVRRPGDALVLATFAPFEVRLLRQFAYELVLLLQAEAGAGLGPDVDEDIEDEFAAITAASGLDTASMGAPVVPPEDAVIARLFPDAYADDDESAAEFRRFTQDRLVEGKYTSAQAVLAMLPEDRQGEDGVAADGDEDLGADAIDDEFDAEIELALNRAAALQWLGTLNDIRLALGTRLGVEQDDDDVWDALPEDDPHRTVHQLYDWLGWLQGTLVAALPRPR